MCITKTKVDLTSRVWGKGEASLALSLKGENGLPAERISDRKREMELMKKKERKAPRRQSGEFHLKKKAEKTGTLFGHFPIVQEKGTWRMLHQGVGLSIYHVLKLSQNMRSTVTHLG